MEQNSQNPKDEKKSRGWIAIIGGAIGVVIGVLVTRRMFVGSFLGYILGDLSTRGIMSLVNDSKPESTTPPPTTPPPIPQPPLALANTPQILDILVAGNHITPTQQATVLGAIKAGRQGFAGDIAVADGMVSPEIRDNAILQQGVEKAEAALVDLRRIKASGAVPVPAWLKTNWGNNGVNPAANPPTIAAGVSAAANIAQNLTLIANTYPHLTAVVEDGVLAATNLARGLAYGDSAQVPLAKMGGNWRQIMETALQMAERNGIEGVDANGKPVVMKDFIAARDSEIHAAIHKALNLGPDHDKGKDGAGR
jgi:hypothetical protein